MNAVTDAPLSAAAREPLQIRTLQTEVQVPGASPVPARSRYAIYSFQRTGSNYLCQRLCAVQGRLGLPAEYLNGLTVQALAPQLLPAGGGKGAPMGQYLSALEAVRTTADGCFALKVQPNQLLPLFRGKAAQVPQFLHRFDRLVLMTRRDKLGQAISGALAMATRQWFNDGRDPALSEEQVRQLMPVVALNLSRYVEEERHILRAGRASGRPTLHVEFEDVVADGDAVFERVTRFLLDGEAAGLQEERDSVVMPERPPGREAARLRASFLAFIAGERPEAAQ